ncbi:MAG TPA: glycosyltransferase family 87 protein [Acidobacteriaceae bacterium]|nr:glycosyltransferase family 87 protein [Acidobacteriaceae bacterium]
MAAGTELILRGPMRAADRGGDFVSPYISAHRLIHGKDPYFSDNSPQERREIGVAPTWVIDPFPIYPPTTLVLVAPLAILSWPAALGLYSWFCTGAYIGLVWLLSGLIDASWSSRRRLAFMAFGLGLAPVHTGIATGNLSVLVFLLSGYGLFLAWRNYDVVAGVLLAMGFCIKPTSAIAALAAVLLYGRIRTFLTSIGVTILIATCAAFAVAHVDPIWKVHYMANLAVVFGPEGAANFASAGGNFDLINLQVPFYVISHNVDVANVLAFLTTTILAAVWLILYFRERKRAVRWSWLGISSLLLIAVLPVYQRNYNAAVVLFAAMWAFSNLKLRDPWPKVAIFVGIVYLVPGEAAIRDIPLPNWLSTNIFWNSVVMCQLTWAIMASIALCYAYMLHRTTPSSSTFVTERPKAAFDHWPF